MKKKKKKTRLVWIELLNDIGQHAEHHARCLLIYPTVVIRSHQYR